MTDIDQAAGLDLDGPKGRGSLRKWGLIGIAVLLLIGGGGAVWYFFLGGREHFAPPQPKQVEAPLPYFIDLKPPLVISMSNAAGSPRFVQLGVSLQLPRTAAAEMVTAVMPEIQDAMRQTLLGFKTDDLQTPEGINRVRKTMTENLNEVMVRVLGAERIAKMTEGTGNPAFVQNILFATLIVE